MTGSSMAETSTLVERLLGPDAYPHAVVEPVRVVETHISWILLTGACAYKIKKPLKLSFLDYSTLERRREFCEEEIRLNGRYAPDLYLGVSTVCGPAHSPGLDRGGEVLDYAVRMRQFDPRDELNALLAAGAVDLGELSELGATIARFHADAARVDRASSFGTAATVRRVLLDNFAELRSLPEAAGWSDRVTELERRVDTHQATAVALIESRRNAGYVRECHGDLHCGNVVRWRGALTPFDGIEFDPALRFIDVMNDLAFLTMDLREHDRRDLRLAVLQAWLESLGDFGGLPLLPYFETYRALVRAKVAALRAMQEDAGSPGRARDCGLASKYLDCALARTTRPTARLVLTCGLSGSGKTWLAHAMAAPLDALHVRSDVERKRLAGLRPLEDSRSPLDGGIYTPEFTTRTYDRLHECARFALGGGESVIVDAAFLKRAERRRMLELAGELSAPFAILHCVAPPAVLRERVASRARAGTDASEAGLAILERQPGFWEDFDDEERGRVVTVETAGLQEPAGTLGRLKELGVR